MFISVCLDICHFMSDLHVVSDKILDITKYYVFLETADAEHEHYVFFFSLIQTKVVHELGITDLKLSK